MNVLAVLLLILFVAWLVEALVEYAFGTFADHIPVLAPYKWLLAYVAMGVGILGAWIYKFDLIYLLSEYAGAGLLKTTFGIVLTGIGIGKGSNFINDILDKFFLKPKPAQPMYNPRPR